MASKSPWLFTHRTVSAPMVPSNHAVETDDMPQVGTRWIAKWSKGRADAFIWMVRGVTQHGIYITCCPQNRSLGHLISPQEFGRDYLPA